MSFLKELVKKNSRHKACYFFAETEGFEPSIRFPVYTLSRRAPSTTRTSLQFLKGCKNTISRLAFENFLCVGRSYCCDFLNRHIFHFGDLERHIFQIAAFVSFAPERYRCEIGRIGFEHDFV